MKQHHSIFPPAASLACALILMLAACTSDALDELPPAGTDPDAPHHHRERRRHVRHRTNPRPGTRLQHRLHRRRPHRPLRGEGQNPGGGEPLPYPTGRQVDAACRHFPALILTRQELSCLLSLPGQ